MLDRKFAELDALLDKSPLKKGSTAFSVHLSNVALDALDPDIINCWHFARVDRKTSTLAAIGENAVSLVDSYPDTSPEKTSLRQQFSQSMLLRIFSSDNE